MSPFIFTTKFSARCAVRTVPQSCPQESKFPKFYGGGGGVPPDPLGGLWANANSVTVLYV
jgi:hypothetical protein